MKAFIKFLNKVACRVCHGMKVIETAGGDTIPCRACNGKGFV